MTSLEFSNEFEVLYNNIMSNQSPGIDEYEKSIFLTKAQLELVKNHFNPKANKLQEGYDDSAKRQYDFSTLIEIKRFIKSIRIGEDSNTEELNEINFRELLQYDKNDNYIGDDKYSMFPIMTRDVNLHRYKFTLPEDFLFFLNEECELERSINNIKVTRNAVVTPINFAELTTLRGATYKLPVQNECWRLYNNTEDVSEIEILPPYSSEIINYAMRYIRKPKPIILINIGNMYGTTIDGLDGNEMDDDVSNKPCCELPEALHPEIVQRAVELAKAAYRTGETEILTQMGTRSE